MKESHRFLLTTLYAILCIAVIVTAVGATAGETVSDPNSEGIVSEKTVAGQDTLADAFSGMTFLTEEGKPVNYSENGEIKGAAVDLLLAALDVLGADITTDDIVISDWPDAYSKAQEGPMTVLFSTKRLPEREELFKWAGPILTSEIGMFTRKDANITIENSDDMQKYTIGVIKDSAAEYILTDLGYPPEKLVIGPNAETLLSMLAEKTIDVWSTGSESAWYLKEASGDEELYEIVYSGNPVEMYYAFSPDTPDTLVSAFQDALDQIKTERSETGFTGYEEILYRYVQPKHAVPPMEDEDAISLVQATVADIAADAQGTFSSVNAYETPYRDSDNPSLYAFVYTEDGTIVADAGNNLLVGENMRGKTDIAGTPLRDQMIDGALANGSTWVEYIFTAPDKGGLLYKSAYAEKVTGSDEKTYIVGAGLFR
ncbi:MAG: transporter substrate-binding domain-containing protein [Methanospirillaceae archaeon]|nr:transporter substrate-binding domain-containing protein [Methanospirillaceae archaeon]